MDKNVWWAWAIKNSIVTLAWIALAIYFDKWWISLFAVLFLSSFIDIKKYHRICDKCGKYSPYADNYNEALDKAKEAGWIHYVDGNKDYCPECQNEI